MCKVASVNALTQLCEHVYGLYITRDSIPCCLMKYGYRFIRKLLFPLIKWLDITHKAHIAHCWWQCYSALNTVRVTCLY